ncbi:MAG: TIR domain-containing protein [Phycisphaerae bacterium]|nr:TIR domain-containing protein [Phycisphaerae bacterium]
MAPEPQAVHHTTGKIVLVGDHSVGKSALGHRMIHGHFEKQASTHGQQFWVFPALGKRRADGTECEAILWDFAGQPDYRLVHALFVDDADLALVLFDASDIRDPLHGVGFWLKQLQTGRSRCPIILVGAQTDRGSCTLTPAELKAFCQKHGTADPIHTSAFTGAGVAELVERMKAMIPWDDKPATVTTATFKRIKDYVLGLKEAQTHDQSIVAPAELRRRLEATDPDWSFTDAEMLTAVGHLENYGYVKKLHTSKGEERVLLAPELLNNLASSFVLEARRNQKGLGSLEEKRLLNGGYAFPELARLTEAERAILLDAAALLFLEHNVCFRETDPLRMEPYLVFPELINLKKPTEEEKATEDGVAYTVTGPTENVFASLVVLLGYTHTFTRTNQWQNNARYEVGEGLVCGFREEAERDGELDFVLCFCPKVGPPVRTLFQGLFESFLARRNLTVIRYEPVRCTNQDCGHLLDRSVVRQRMKEGKTFACCNECGEKLVLPKMEEPIQLTREVQAEVETQRRTAEQRTRFEQAIYRVQAYVAEQKINPPECFISYAWGVPEHERWVEKRLATDLQKAGIGVVLDRWENDRAGKSVSRFVSRIADCGIVIPVGTPLYFQKFQNKVSSTGSVVASEVDLISQRLMGTESDKETVMPVLLAGEKKTSLPPLMWDRVHRDFRNESAYFSTAFDVILDLYHISCQDPAIADLQESLGEPRMR